MSDLDDVRTRLCIALRIPDDAPDWLELTEHRLHAWWAFRERQAPTPIDISTLAGRMKAAREITGLSQNQLAARVGLPTGAHVSLMERGKADLPAERLPGLCMSLGVSQAWLLGESEAGGPPIPREVLRAMCSPSWFRYKRSQREFGAQKQKAGAIKLAALRAELAAEKARKVAP
jgi:transcriptional regulator with XRE-family HTH domain